MTSTGRIGSLSILNDTLRDVTATQTRLSDLQNQISSGLKSRDFEGLNGSVEQFTQLNNQLGRATQFKSINQVNVSKLQTADVALSQMIDIADQMKNVIIGANGATINNGNIPQILTDMLASLGTELNASFNGNYIFGGTDTVNAPVPNTTVNNTVTGTPDDNYYVGSKYNATMRADERTVTEFPMRADDIAIQKIFAAAKQAISAATSGDAHAMGQAQQLIQSGQADLISARSRVGTAVNNIQTISDRLSALSTYWTELSDAVSKTDIVAASTQVSSYQAILQASFQVYARLSQLRLSDYLK